MKTIFVYGLGGAEKNFRVLDYQFVKNEFFTVAKVITIANNMKAVNPAIRDVYMIDNSYSLKKFFNKVVFENSIEGWQCFKDILRREGVLIL